MPKKKKNGNENPFVKRSEASANKLARQIKASDKKFAKSALG